MTAIRADLFEEAIVGCIDRSECMHQPGEIVIPLNNETAHSGFSQRRILIAVLLTLLAVAVALPGAGGQTAKPPASQDVDFVVTANEVSLNLVVHDKRNKPVLDLKQDEIAISDNGTPVKLNSFHLVNGAQKSECLITLVFDRPVQLAGKNLETDPTDDEECARSGREDTRDDSRERFLLFGSHRRGAASASERVHIGSEVACAGHQLGHRAEKSWHGGGASPLEKQLIAAALTGVGPEGKAVGAHDRALDKLLFNALTDSGKIAQNQHLRPFLAGLLALAKSQQQIHQRKALIFFTAFQEEKNNLSTMEAIQSIIGSANQAGESIYVVDLNSSNRTTSQMSQTSPKPWALQVVFRLPQAIWAPHSKSSPSSRLPFCH